MLPQQHTLATPYMVGPVHCYSTLINDELVLFDTGPPTREAREYLREHLDLKRLRHVIIGHCHIDHYGLARWLERNSHATIYLPYRDGLKIARHQQRLQNMFGLMSRYGFDNEFLVRFEKNMQDGTVFPSLPEQYRIIEEDLPDHLGIDYIPCPGHSQSDLVLIRDNWAITGDVMLRGIFQSPLLDVDLHSGERFRNYDAYCSTLIQLAGLRGRTILPGHRCTIDSIDESILFYVTKLLERSARIRRTDPGRSVAQLAFELLGDKGSSPFLVYLKASELVFMRDFLEHPELLRQSLETIDVFDKVAGLYHSAVN